MFRDEKPVMIDDAMRKNASRFMLVDFRENCYIGSQRD